MARFAHLVVKYRRPIMIFYLVLLIPSFLGYIHTGTDYDLMGYMPPELESRRGNEILEDKFELAGVGMLLVKDKSVYRIRELVSEVEALEGIDEVFWPDDFIDLTIPIDFWDEQLRERFIYNQDTMLLQVLFEESARSPKTHQAVEQINWIIADNEQIVFGGEPAIVNEIQEKTEEEIFYYLALAIIALLLVLTLSLRSYLDPWLFIFAVSTAVAINMGSNYFLGEISFLTDSVAAVMQLGISLNYSIFLMHRFEEEKSKHTSITEAMESAIAKTAAAITTSAITTISSFTALVFMEHGLGQDMGIVLAKGIFFSLVVTLTFLPGLLLTFNRIGMRLQHRILLPSFEPVARIMEKGRWGFLLLFFFLLYPSFWAQEQVSYYYAFEEYLPEDSQVVQDLEHITETIGAEEFVYIVTEDKGSAREFALVGELRKIAEVDEIASLTEQADPAIPEMIIPVEVIEEYKTDGYRYLQVFVADVEDEEEIFAVVDDIRETTARIFDEYYVTGETALTRDMAIISERDSPRVLVITILSIALIIGISFRSFMLPLILILVIQTSIWINMGVVYFQDLTVSSLTPIMIGAIQLGATVDYAIYFIVRYRNNLDNCPNRIEAAEKTINETGRSIFTSALTLFAATIGISQMATVVATVELSAIIGRGALISMGMIFLGLPSLLLTFDKLIRPTTAGWPALPYASSKQDSSTRNQ